MEIGDTVKAMYGTGEVNGVAKIVGSCDAAQLFLETADGKQFWWRKDLCREVTSVEKSSFTKKRNSYKKNSGKLDRANCPHCGCPIKLVGII
jgi:hypothetical protein